MKAMSKAETIRHLKRSIKSMDYYLENYIKPYKEEVQNKKMKEMAKTMGVCSGIWMDDYHSFSYLIADLEDCLKTIKKLKVK